MNINYFVKLLRPVYTPNDYLNATFDDVISLCWTEETMPSHGSLGKSFKFYVILSLRVISLTIKKYAICRSPSQIETYSLALDS